MVTQWIACVALQLCGAFFVWIVGVGAGSDGSREEDDYQMTVMFVAGLFLLAAGVAVRP